MASMEFLHQPCWTHLLIVLEAKTEGLAKQWGKYAGPAKAVFQPSHWMDRHVATKYLQWLKTLYLLKNRPCLGSFWASYFVQVYNAQRLTMDIRRTFQKCSLNPWGEGKLFFAQHPASLSREAL